MNQPAPTTDRRDRYAAAIWARYPDTEPSRTGLVMANPHGIADAVMAVADAEQAELRAEVTRQTELREHWQQEVAHADARLRELERRLTGQTPPAAVPSAPTSRPALSEAERTMLAYALDQAQEHIWSRDGFTDEDQAAVDSLRRLAAAPAAEEQPESETSCGPPPDACDGEAGEPCASHEREAAHAEGEHCFCGPECRTAESAPYPAERTWRAELYDPLAEEWAPGTRYADRDQAVSALVHGRRLGPAWKDGTPTERRLVRATTTYAVEAGPKSGEQPS